MDKKQNLINAYRVLKQYCKENCMHCDSCIFWKNDDCMLEFGNGCG